MLRTEGTAGLPLYSPPPHPPAPLHLLLDPLQLRLHVVQLVPAVQHLLTLLLPVGQMLKLVSVKKVRRLAPASVHDNLQTKTCSCLL